MITPTTHIGDDLEYLSALLAVLVVYIEEENKDTRLTTVSISLKNMAGIIKEKYMAAHEAQ